MAWGSRRSKGGPLPGGSWPEGAARTAELDPNTSWPEIVPGPLGTPPPEFAHRRQAGPLAPATMPSGDQVSLAVRYEDVRALLASPACSRNLRLPGLPRLVSGIGIDDDPNSLINQDP